MSRVEKIKRVVQEFYQQQEEYKRQEQLYKESKKNFEEFMTKCMADKKKEVIESDCLSGDNIIVTKVERTSIEWYPEKLEKRIEKRVARKVIKKRYTISNMRGLTKYLKSCGVDPKVFAKYLLIEKEVDQDAVDRLGEIGELTPRNISGCYIVKCSKPYFKLSLQKRASDDREEKKR